MRMLLAFAPFIVFVIVERLAGPTAGLMAGSAISVALLVREWMKPGREIKVLECGTALLFGGLATYTLVTRATWSIVAVRLCVDAGLLLVVLVSIAMRRPFTLQYAREQASSEVWNSPAFLKTNYVITAVWALAFVVMVGADLVMVYLPNLPLKVGVGATVFAIVGAMRFTSWYTGHVQAQSSNAAF